MMRIAASALMLVLAGAPAAFAEEPSPGMKVYEVQCSHCHAPGGDRPGTLQLAATRGEDKAVLTEREDLTAEYVRYVVRHGLRAMPAFYPSDLTDADLEALIAFLTR